MLVNQRKKTEPVPDGEQIRFFQYRVLLCRNWTCSQEDRNGSAVPFDGIFRLNRKGVIRHWDNIRVYQMLYQQISLASSRRSKLPESV